ncbi:uncharacterized protein LOC119362018 isoform X2 [Triticum dicoccoides]|uniref:uncharacterized protein LOC119362018 isoform X2 n=1 Tax=Triticum dicoccoides TaxID=85692 RepID=UPI000E7B9345|nr:uncharacterized protein LOC119362018 isoform X2 [Triticum dicoccoides]
MAMGMGSNNKRSRAGVVVSCVVLGIALLVIDVAGKEGRARAEQLAEEHGDATYCSALCRKRSDSGPCYNECLVTRQEEARGGGAVGGPAGLLEMPTERVGREGEEKGKQADAVIPLSDPVWCYNACREHPELDYNQCVNDCYAENMPDAGWESTQQEVEEARGGVVDGLTAVGKPHCDWFRDCSVTPCVWRCGKRAQEEVGIHKCDWFRDCSVTPCVWRCGKRAQEEDDEETRRGALINVLAAPRHEVAVGACSSTVYVESCYACCQREVTRNPEFDWYACIRSCHD